jgi:hypothetical protein
VEAQSPTQLAQNGNVVASRAAPARSAITVCPGFQGGSPIAAAWIGYCFEPFGARLPEGSAGAPAATSGRLQATISDWIEFDFV